MSACKCVTVHGDAREVRLLLEGEVQFDLDSPMGTSRSTPLYAAALTGLLDIAQLLLDAKANPNRGLRDGTTPLVATAHSGRVDVVRLLLE